MTKIPEDLGFWIWAFYTRMLFQFVGMEYVTLYRRYWPTWAYIVVGVGSAAVGIIVTWLLRPDRDNQESKDPDSDI